MKKTKFLHLLFTIALCMSSGCDIPQNINERQQIVIYNETELEPVNLTWYSLTNVKQADQDLVFDAVSDEIMKKINATVKFIPITYADYDQKLQVAIASGEEFDLCFTAAWRNNYYQNISKGAFKPLDELLEKHGKNTYGNIPEKYWNAAKVNGKIYGSLNYQIFSMTRCAWFKKDLVDKYNFDISTVKKLEDMEPFLEIVYKNEKDILPYDPRPNAPGTWGLYAEVTGLEPLSGNVPLAIDTKAEDSTKIVNMYDTAEFKQYLYTIRDWFKKGYIQNDIASIKDLTPIKKKGGIACGLDTYKPGLEGVYMASYGFESVIVPLMEPISLTTSVIASMTAISESSKNPERAMILIELLNTDIKLYNLLCHGIENEHYRKISDNVIKVFPDSRYAPNIDWTFGNQFNSYLLLGQPSTVWEDTKEMNENATPSPIFGFSITTDPILTEVVNLNMVINEFLPALVLGAVDPDEYLPKFLDKLNNAGLSEVIYEYNKQIAEWKLSNEN